MTMAVAIHNGYTLWCNVQTGGWVAQMPPDAGESGLGLVAALVGAYETWRESPPADEECE